MNKVLEIIFGIINNKALITPIIVIIITQLCKVVYFSIRDKKFSVSKVVTDGGMPSSHSALMASITTIVGIELGVDTIYFALSSLVSLIIMHDASGIRYAGGKHAKILNKILEKDKELAKELGEEKELVELLGHTKKEVYCGAIVGVVLTIILYNVGLLV